MSDVSLDLKYGLFKYNMRDYYAILGVPIDTDVKTIRLRYHKIAYQLHPDTCTDQADKYKAKSSEILSKLVNPAYENLFKDKPRRECELMLSDVSMRLKEDAHRITISTDTAKKLFQEEKDPHKLYHSLVNMLAKNQYHDINLIVKKIALISELNMVYLMIKDQTVKEPSKITATPPNINNNSTVTTSESSQDSDNQKDNESKVENQNETQEKVTNSSNSKVDKLIIRARQNQEDGNITQGILDLREALKIESDNVTANALIGLLYLKQGNTTYAKIHIKKAYNLDKENPDVKESKEKLDEKLGTKKGSKSASKKGGKDKKGGKSSSKKGDKDKKGGKDDKKKEAPKIFGIPLW